MGLLQHSALAGDIRAGGRQAHRQQALHVLGTLHTTGQRKTQAPFQMRQLRTALAHLRLRAAQAAREPIDGLGAAVKLAAELRGQRIPVTPHVTQHAGPVRADKFCGTGGRGCAHIGHKIDDGHIGFMSDACHDGNLRSGHGTCYRFFVEGPQIFNAAAAPAQDDDIDFCPGIDRIEHGGNAVGGAGALHRHRIDDHGHMRRPPAQRGQHVAQSRRLQ